MERIMSSTSYTPIESGVGTVGTTPRSFLHFVSRVAGSVGRFVTLARAERELGGLDDRLLADIGLRRSEIHRMVWGGRVR
jgi:uncharacterized protein YjiS (DUF1127 family)